MESIITLQEYKDLVSTNGPFIQKDVKADGNCFFSAISLLKYGTEKSHDRIRYEICGYLKCIMDSIDVECEEARRLEMNPYLFPDNSNILKSKEEIINFLKFTIITNCMSRNQYASTMDLCELGQYGETEQILTACLMYNINIKLYSDILPDEQAEIILSDYTTDISNPTYNLYLSNKIHHSGHYNAVILRSVIRSPSTIAMNNKTKKKSKSPPKSKNGSVKKRSPEKKGTITIGDIEYKGERADMVEYMRNNGATDDAITTILRTKGKIPTQDTVMSALADYYETN